MPEEQVTIACVVEGHGELPSVPVILRRIANDLSIWDVNVPPPFRRSKGSLVAAGGIEGAVDAQARRVGSAGGVLVLLDADDDLPCKRGPALLERARKARPDKAVSVVLANREFEAWFIAAAASLGGHSGLPVELCPPANPEAIRDAKGWLRQQVSAGPRYKETVDQARLAAAFDMSQARTTSPSFAKFYREAEFLLRHRT